MSSDGRYTHVEKVQCRMFPVIHSIQMSELILNTKGERGRVQQRSKDFHTRMPLTTCMSMYVLQVSMN